MAQVQENKRREEADKIKDDQPLHYTKFQDQQGQNLDRSTSQQINMSQEASSLASNYDQQDLNQDESLDNGQKPKHYTYFMAVFILLYVVFTGLLIAANVWAISQQ